MYVDEYYYDNPIRAIPRNPRLSRQEGTSTLNIESSLNWNKK